MNKLVELLESEMKKTGQNISELAQNIGVSQPTLSKILRYRIMQPSWETLQAVAAYFHRPVSYFLDDQADPREAQEYEEAQLLELYREIRALDPDEVEVLIDYLNIRVKRLRERSRKQA